MNLADGRLRYGLQHLCQRRPAELAQDLFRTKLLDRLTRPAGLVAAAKVRPYWRRRSWGRATSLLAQRRQISKPQSRWRRPSMR